MLILKPFGINGSDKEKSGFMKPHPQKAHGSGRLILFDDAQSGILYHRPPLILIGSAGSGKTSLVLEKLKTLQGEGLYVTLSPYLVHHARRLYGDRPDAQEEQAVDFLSFEELLGTLRIPWRQEITAPVFLAWVERQSRPASLRDGQKLYEEFRGVIAGSSLNAPYLSEEAYLNLGIRQAIYAAEERKAVYQLFQRYVEFLNTNAYFDSSILAYAYGQEVQACYDYVVVDEVQDFTNSQLAFILKTLKDSHQFLLCGDANQIVYPNFFSWSKLKSQFYQNKDPQTADITRILTRNYRNTPEVTALANGVLKVKNARFGSVDRESHLLMESHSSRTGQVCCVPFSEQSLKDLNDQTRLSTHYAVLVLTDGQKEKARQYFETPLLFSIQEAKGLEYENIVLHRFVSDHRAEFTDIVDGVEKRDLAADTLDYRRAKDKHDKSLEVYKFYVNALYVALTRAVKNLYLIESDTAHPLFGLLDLAPAGQVKVEAKQATLEDWQKEARKLELQGKQEQAEAIRRGILKQTPVPWPVFDEAKTRELLVKVFREQAPGGKLRQQLYDIATCHDLPVLAYWLAQEARFDAAKNYSQQHLAQGRKTYMFYFAHNFKDILRQCDQHGLEHRLAMNQTPLMAAAAAGNVALVEALLTRGADRETVDQYGWNALHWAMHEAFRDPKFATGPFAALYELLAPASIDVNTGERLVRIDRHLSEYFLFQTLWVLFKSRFVRKQRRPYAAFETQAILEAWKTLPTNVVRPERNKRQHLSGVLARNEVERDYAYNRALFVRVTQGWYQFNPKLSVRRKEGGENDDEVWMPIHQALNLAHIGEFAYDFVWTRIDDYLAQAGLPARGVPIAAEKAVARWEAEERQREAAEAVRAQREAEWREQQRRRQAAAAEAPRWGSKEAKRREIERLREEIAARKKT